MTNNTSNRSGMPAIYGVVAAAEVERLRPLSEMSGAAAQGEVRVRVCVCCVACACPCVRVCVCVCV